jgi:hypothetical protein
LDGVDNGIDNIPVGFKGIVEETLLVALMDVSEWSSIVASELNHPVIYVESQIAGDGE